MLCFVLAIFYYWLYIKVGGVYIHISGKMGRLAFLSVKNGKKSEHLFNSTNWKLKIGSFTCKKRRFWLLSVKIWLLSSKNVRIFSIGATPTLGGANPFFNFKEKTNTEHSMCDRVQAQNEKKYFCFKSNFRILLTKCVHTVSITNFAEWLCLIMAHKRKNFKGSS